jgi:hypothetical protein
MSHKRGRLYSARMLLQEAGLIVLDEDPENLWWMLCPEAGASIGGDCASVLPKLYETIVKRSLRDHRYQALKSMLLRK